MKDEKDDTTEILTFDNPLEGIKIILTNEVEGRIDSSSLFTSSEGKKLARQVEDQKQFTTAGMLLPLIQDLMKRIIPKLPKLFSDGKLLSAIDESIKDESDLAPEERELMIRFQDLMKYILKSMEEDVESSYEIPWGEKAVERYLGSFVLSLHTYVEAFVDSTIDRLVANDGSRVQILEYCDKHFPRRSIDFSELDEVEGGKYEVISELVKRTLPLSLPRRMLVICDALGIRKQIDGFIAKTSNGGLLEDFRHFCDMRNQIAHCEPAPSLADYGIELAPFDWKETKRDLKRDLDNAEIEPPRALYEIIDAASEWGQQSSVAEYFSLLESVFEMSILFVAAFDYFISSTRKM